MATSTFFIAMVAVFLHGEIGRCSASSILSYKPERNLQSLGITRDTCSTSIPVVPHTTSCDSAYPIVGFRFTPCSRTDTRGYCYIGPANSPQTMQLCFEAQSAATKVSIRVEITSMDSTSTVTALDQPLEDITITAGEVYTVSGTIKEDTVLISGTYVIKVQVYETNNPDNLLACASSPVFVSTI